MKEITTTEVGEILDNSNVTIVDVREDFEVRLGTIPGAKHIPLDQLVDRFRELEKKNKQIIICRSGGRSEAATKFLNEQGYDAYNMIGGMMAWTGEIE